MAPEIVNKELYYALKNRIHRFNVRYGEKLKHIAGDEGLLTEDIFEDLRWAWTEVSMDTLENDSARNLDKEVVISEKSFKHLTEAVKNLRERLCSIAAAQKLGEIYVDVDGKEHEDFTYVSREIFEICIFATYTYTNFFQQCQYMDRNYFERELGPIRAKQLANAMYPGEKNLHVFEIDGISRMWLDNPLGNVLLDIAKHLHTEENYTVGFGDSNDRPPYYEVKKKNDEYRRKAQQDEEEERARRQREKEEEEALRPIRAEEERLEWERQLPNQEEDFSDYESLKHVIPVVENENPPSKINEHFYAYFAKLGIDEKDLNAQSLIGAMHRVQMAMKDNETDHYEFCKLIKPIYRQLQVLAFEARAKSDIENGREINFNETAETVDEVMGALYYTVNPVGFKKGTLETRIRAAAILNGTYMSEERKVSRVIREDVIKYVKHIYKTKGFDYFKEKGEEFYLEYASEEKSTGSVIRQFNETVSYYDRYKAALADNRSNDTVHQQSLYRKFYMDNAYALEKRIETRYPSFWSKLFHFVSYFRQTSVLDHMKKALGIKAETHIRDIMVDENLNLFVKDFSDVDDFNKTRNHYNEAIKTGVLEHITNNLKVQLQKDLPEVDIHDVINEVVKLPVEPQKNNEIIEANAIDTEIEKQLREQKRIEEARRKEEERLEKERLEKERIEREKEEAEERRRREEEERRAERERLVRAEKEDLYNQKLDELELKIERLSETYNKFYQEERLNAEHYEKQINSIPEKVSILEAQKADIPIEIDNLEAEGAKIMTSISEKIKDITENVIPKKDIKDARLESAKAIGKDVNNTSFKNANKINEYIDNDPVIKALRSALEDINKQISEKQASIPKITGEINKLWREQERLKKLANSPSEELTTTASELKKLKDEYAYMRAHKDDIIESGEGLGFHEGLFFEGENFRVRDSILRPSNYQPISGRETVIINDLKEEKDIPFAPPIEEGGNAPQMGIVK